MRAVHAEVEAKEKHLLLSHNQSVVEPNCKHPPFNPRNMEIKMDPAPVPSPVATAPAAAIETVRTTLCAIGAFEEPGQSGDLAVNVDLPDGGKADFDLCDCVFLPLPPDVAPIDFPPDFDFCDCLTDPDGISTGFAGSGVDICECLVDGAGNVNRDIVAADFDKCDCFDGEATSPFFSETCRCLLNREDGTIDPDLCDCFPLNTLDESAIDTAAKVNPDAFFAVLDRCSLPATKICETDPPSFNPTESPTDRPTRSPVAVKHPSVLMLLMLLVAWLKNGDVIDKLIYNKCQMFQSKEATTETDEAALQQDLQVVMTHMQDESGFSVNTLRSLYKSLLSDLDMADMTQEQMDLLVEDTLTSIDLNGDGTIDPNELASVELPSEMGDFVFDDVVACTSSNFKTALGETCVTPDNVVEFLNNFYAGTKVMSPAMADQIRQDSGADACYTRSELESAFAVNGMPSSTTASLETLSSSAGSAAQATCAWTAAVGTALFVAGI